MKKLLLLLFAVSLYFGNNATAQSRSGSTGNSAGITVDFGDGSTLVGPALKHYFDRNNAGQLELLIGKVDTI